MLGAVVWQEQKQAGEEKQLSRVESRKEKHPGLSFVQLAKLLPQSPLAELLRPIIKVQEAWLAVAQ